MALGGKDEHGYARYLVEENYFIDHDSWFFSKPQLIENPAAYTDQVPNLKPATPSDIDVLEMASSGSRHMSCIGASRPLRDAVDTRIIQEFFDGTGAIGIGENDRTGGHNVNQQRTWDIYGEPTRHPPSYDTDNDGMADDWEILYGLNPDDPNDHALDKDGDGYTNIEEYLAIAALC